MNAMKYTEKGEIRVSGSMDGTNLNITVTDTGKGMSPELVAQLNDKQSLIYDNKTGDSKKFRFGYAIIKDLLLLLKGTMLVESRLKEGTKVTILCPDLKTPVPEKEEKLNYEF
jgi:signal transduction histidine kinase